MKGWLKIVIMLLVLAAGVRLFFAILSWSDVRSKQPDAKEARREARAKAYIEISPEARVRLLEKVKKIKLGDSIEYVLEELGRPGADQKATTQPIEEIPMRTASRVLTYYIRKSDKESFDKVFDEHVHIFFDSDDYVGYVYIKLKQEGDGLPPPPAVRLPKGATATVNDGSDQPK
jgi:hypothetical protein